MTKSTICPEFYARISRALCLVDAGCTHRVFEAPLGHSGVQRTLLFAFGRRGCSLLLSYFVPVLKGRKFFAIRPLGGERAARLTRTYIHAVARHEKEAQSTPKCFKDLKNVMIDIVAPHYPRGGGKVRLNVVQ